jgi:hypothetical protein
MTRRALLLWLVFAAWTSAEASSPVRSMKDLTFLTRDGCVNTPKMRANLDQALKALSWSTDYQVLDSGTLQTTDARRAYPTPTLLYKNRDIFGMPVPKPPYDEPT